MMGEFFRSPRRALIFVIAVAMALFHLYTAAIRPFPGIQQRAIHIAFALALTYLIFPSAPTHRDGRQQERDTTAIYF